MMFHTIQTILVLTFESESDTDTNFESSESKLAIISFIMISI